MNLTQLQNQKESVLATARELASGDGDLAQVKSLMAEAKGIEERIETIMALGQGHPVAAEVAVEIAPGRYYKETKIAVPSFILTKVDVDGANLGKAYVRDH